MAGAWGDDGRDDLEDDEINIETRPKGAAGRVYRGPISDLPPESWCTGCNTRVDENWTYCPWCGAQGRSDGPAE